MVEWLPYITAIGVLIAAIAQLRSAASKAASDISEASASVYQPLLDELKRCRKERSDRDKIIVSLILGCCSLIDQLDEAGLVPVYSVPGDWIRKWSNGHPGGQP